MMSWKRKKKITFSRLLPVFCILIPILCFLFLLNASLPELTSPGSTGTSNRMIRLDKASEGMHLDEFGEMMIAMLPTDLAFTIFVPSEEAFKNTLRLHSNDSIDEQKKNDIFATVSRVMGFSTVPRYLPMSLVPSDEIVLYSVSGYILYVWKDSDHTLVVNNIKSKQVDIRRGKIIVHIILGVLMDGDFAQSLDTYDVE